MNNVKCNIVLLWKKKLLKAETCERTHNVVGVFIRLLWIYFMHIVLLSFFWARLTHYPELQEEEELPHLQVCLGFSVLTSLA